VARAPLAEVGDSELARREAERLQEQHALAVEGELEARLAGGEHAYLIAELRTLVDAPLRERPRRLLMLALCRAGREADALAVPDPLPVTAGRLQRRAYCRKRARCERVRYGHRRARAGDISLGDHGVTCPTVRIHPAITAQAEVTSGVLHGGRYNLGVGSGEALTSTSSPAAGLNLKRTCGWRCSRRP
jgi:hypothetical protein